LFPEFAEDLLAGEVEIDHGGDAADVADASFRQVRIAIHRELARLVVFELHRA
jgi:hypothetical protein